MTISPRTRTAALGAVVLALTGAIAAPQISYAQEREERHAAVALNDEASEVLEAIESWRDVRGDLPTRAQADRMAADLDTNLTRFMTSGSAGVLVWVADGDEAGFAGTYSDDVPAIAQGMDAVDVH